VRVDLKVQRATILDVAGRFLTSHGDLGGLDEFPLATLVMRDIGLDVLLHFLSGDRLLDLEDLFLSLLLLVVHGAVRAHA